MCGFAASALEVALLTVLCFIWSVKKHYVTKILLTVCEIFSDENGCNYDS